MRLNPGVLKPGLWLPVLLMAVFITACGSGEDAVDGARDQPNRFGGNKNSLDDFSTGSTGDSSNTAGLADNEVRVTLEVPAHMAPNAEQTRRNLRIVQPQRIHVYQTNSSLQNLGESAISTRKDDNGFTVITFLNGLPLAPNVIIEAQYGNATMRAIAADADRDIKINPFSEYLVRNTLPQYSPGEFQRILDCANNTLCLNKFVWSSLTDQVHDFEIDIPTNASVVSALNLLSERGDFVSYVTSMADYALLGNQSSGEVSASSADYNSVFMGVELGQTFLEDRLTNSGQWGVRLAHEEQTAFGDNPAYLYPGLTLASFDIFNINVTSLATQIPYYRNTLVHKQGNEFFTRGGETWPLNSHYSSPGPATLVNDTRLLAGRSLYQSITGKNSSRPIGWTRNPYFLDAFTGSSGGSNSGPDRALAGYFSAGKAIKLESEKGQYKRREELESHYLSVLELNLLRQEGFDASTLNGRDYNTVYLAMRFAESTTPMQVEAGIGDWQIGSAGAITQSQSFTTVSRDSSGAVVVDSAGTHTDEWVLSQRTALLSSGNKNIGRLNLDVDNPAGQFGQPDLGIGASVPDGSLLAFNLANAASLSGIIGNGLLIAAEKSSSGAPGTGHYRVQGFVLGLEDGTNRLTHFDQGTLDLSGSTASLNSKTLEVLHSVGNETVSAPESGEVATVLTYTSDSEGQVSFSAGDLSLTGFVTPDGSQFFLVYRNTLSGEEQLGLLMATLLP